MARVGEGETDFRSLRANPNKGKDVARRIVASIGVGVFTENDVLVSMHNLDAPMAAVGAEKRFARRLAGRQTGDQIDDFYFRVFPFAIFLALPKACDAANVLDARPVFLDAGGSCGKHLD